MTREEALARHKQLEEFKGLAPGGGSNYTRSWLKQIESEFAWELETDEHLSRKVREACHYLEIWLSPRRWQRHDLEVLKGAIANDVRMVRRLIDRKYPENY